MTSTPLTTYQSLCTQFYELEFAHRTNKLTTHDAQIIYLLDLAQKAIGPILEPMCGTGRLILPLLAAGFEVQGFDASPFMLEAFQQKWAQISNKPAPVQQCFIQEFLSPKQYGLIFIPFGSIGLVTDQNELKKSLQNMYRHLKPGGTFMIEIDTIASLPQELGAQNRGSHAIDDQTSIRLTTVESYNPRTQIMLAKCTYQLIKNGAALKTEQEDFYQYLYTFDEMDILLKACEFVDIKKYKNYNLEPATDRKTEVLIYECVK